MPRPLEDIVKRKSGSRPAAKPYRQPPSPPKPPEWPREREVSQEAVPERSRYMLWTVAAFSIALLFVALSFLWAKAEVEVFPRTEKITLNDNFSAVKDAPGAELAFELVAIGGEESKVLEATEEKTVSERASGTVVIFNNYSSATQRLDIDTRLSGSNGKIYKTRKAVVVPGKKSDGSPGTVEVGIYASEAGDSYNSEPLDFQIVGFKGTPKYEKFLVRSKAGTEITGGFQGKTLVVSLAEREGAVSELSSALKEELFKKANEEIPPGFVLFKEAVVFTPDKVDMPFGDEELVVTLNGTLHGILFKEEELAQKIGDKKVADYADEAVMSPNLRDLKFTLGPVGDVSLGDMKNITFNLSGTTDLVWKIDTEKFKSDLLGRSKRDFTSILSAYKNIDRAELSLAPFWKRMLPEEAEKIEVEVHYPEAK